MVIQIRAFKNKTAIGRPYPSAWDKKALLGEKIAPVTYTTKKEVFVSKLKELEHLLTLGKSPGASTTTLRQIRI